MKKENEIAEKLKNHLKKSVLEVKIPRERRIFVKIEKTALKNTIKYLAHELEFNHLSTITGVDTDEEIELIYHLAYKGSIELSLKATVPKEKTGYSNNHRYYTRCRAL